MGCRCDSQGYVTEEGVVVVAGLVVWAGAAHGVVSAKMPFFARSLCALHSTRLAKILATVHSKLQCIFDSQR